MRKPDFTQLAKVLERKRPDRPTMFEFFLNPRLYGRISGIAEIGGWGTEQWAADTAKAYAAAGYDFFTMHAGNLWFPTGQHERNKSISQNQGAVITDRESFTRYPWPDPDAVDYSRMQRVHEIAPEGMKPIIFSHLGLLENAISLCGYENLAMMVLDDPQLAHDVFDAIGSRLVRYYELAGKYGNVGAMISCDDWGFAQQTMFSPEDMREFVFPWHRTMVKAIHEAGCYAILHSCGNLAAVMDDIIDDMQYDAKHSFEDKIVPVEEAYRKYGSRIAILGGIDMDFICRSSREQIQQRCRRMLELTEEKGGYALGTGNSVPEYVPDENYLAMIQIANPEARFVV